MGSFARLQDTDDSWVSRFRELSRTYCETLGRNGVPFRPYVSEELPHFSKLPQEKQRAALEWLAEAIAIFSEAEAAGESLLDSKRFLWRTLSRLRMTPRPDVLDKVEDGDIIEIYLPDYFQVFRNLDFFRYFSCTLEELVSFPIFELARFPEEALTSLNQIVADLLGGRITDTFASPVAPYVIEETAGIDRLRIEVAIRYFSPVATQGLGTAIIVTNRSRIIGRGLDSARSRK